MAALPALPFQEVNGTLEYPNRLPVAARSPLPQSPLRSSTVAVNPSVSILPIRRSRPSTGPLLPAAFSWPPPKKPSKWLWCCHGCGLIYPLGVTNRCLIDGHQFCTGLTTDRRTGRRIRHEACECVFDYLGWKDFGKWRRRELRLQADTRSSGLKSPTRRSCRRPDSPFLSKPSANLLAVDENNENQEEKEEFVSQSSSPAAESGTADMRPSSAKILDSRRWNSNCEIYCDFPSHCRRPRQAPSDNDIGKSISSMNNRINRRIRSRSRSSSLSPETTKHQEARNPSATTDTHISKKQKLNPAQPAQSLSSSLSDQPRPPTRRPNHPNPTHNPYTSPSHSSYPRRPLSNAYIDASVQMAQDIIARAGPWATRPRIPPSSRLLARLADIHVNVNVTPLPDLSGDSSREEEEKEEDKGGEDEDEDVVGARDGE